MHEMLIYKPKAMIMIMMTMLKIYHPISPAVFFPSRGSAKNPRAQKTTYHTTQVINELIMKHVAAKIKNSKKCTFSKAFQQCN
jgi:hypothetical protein